MYLMVTMAVVINNGAVTPFAASIDSLFLFSLLQLQTPPRSAAVYVRNLN